MSHECCEFQLVVLREAKKGSPLVCGDFIGFRISLVFLTVGLVSLPNIDRIVGVGTVPHLGASSKLNQHQVDGDLVTTTSRWGSMLGFQVFPRDWS